MVKVINLGISNTDLRVPNQGDFVGIRDPHLI